MEIVFNREVLYSEIWSTPISTLCRKYQLSDNGLRKVCKALSIPLPVRGHWAKVAAGHSTKATPLPPSTGATTFISRPSLPPADEWRKQEGLLAAQISFEKAPENKIIVAAVLVQPHALVASSLRAIAKVRSTLEKSRADAEKPKKRLSGAGWAPNFNGMKWYDHERRGLLLDPTDTVLPLRVSLEAVDRALRIWDALIKGAVGRGMKAGLAGNRLTLSIEKETIELRMSERVAKRLTGKPWPKDSESRPTGELRIFVCCRGETKFEDGAKGALEGQLNAIFCNVHRTFSAQKVWRARLLEERRLAGIAGEQREIERLAREETRRQIEEQKRLEQDLIIEAQAWHQAQQIRAYVLSLQSATAAGASAAHGFAQWAEWANGVADRLDPSKVRIEL